MLGVLPIVAPEAPERQLRRFPRVVLSAHVLMRRSGRINYQVRVLDLSPQGCRVEFVDRPQHQELLWVRFDGLEAIPAQVAWTQGAFAGLEFPRPIYLAVFNLLLARLNAA